MLSLIFFIAFPFLIWKAWQNHQAAKASVDWPTTTGTITKVERVKRLFRSFPKVAYSYSVDGKPYGAERISFATGYRPKDVEAILNRYAVGQSVPVAYAPGKPAEGVLETGANAQTTSSIRMLIILFLLLLGLNIAQYFLKAANASKEQRRVYSGESARP